MDQFVRAMEFFQGEQIMDDSCIIKNSQKRIYYSSIKLYFLLTNIVENGDFLLRSNLLLLKGEVSQ